MQSRCAAEIAAVTHSGRSSHVARKADSRPTAAKSDNPAKCSRPSVALASSIPRLIATRSLAAGTANRPSSSATGPSAATPPSLSTGSRGRSKTGLPSIFAYSRPRRSSSASPCGSGKSENATAPAAAAAAISASFRVPGTVSGAIASRVGQGPRKFRSRRAAPATAAVVNPPASACRAHREPTPAGGATECGSTNPGQTTDPSAWIVSSGGPSRAGTICPPRTKMSAASSRPAAGSITRPPRIASVPVIGGSRSGRRGRPSAPTRRSPPA